MRLSATTLPSIPAAVTRPAYDREAQAIGIVHFGIGAFHRAHQAMFTDDAMAGGERDWAIAGVSLRSPAVHAMLAPQDGLYSVAIRGRATAETRIVGAVREVIVATHAPDRLARLLAARETRIVSLTITEKGYLRQPDGTLDLSAAAGGATVYAVLVAAFRARRAAGLPGLTIICCDNLADNGGVLDGLIRAYLDRYAPDLLPWFARECACPATMVDRIVPATREADREAAGISLGLRDEAAVVTEPFRQWVIEDRFATPRPGWERVGAQLVGDVRPYETAKLRMLNGAHSALAYCGLAAGHRYVHEAVADPRIRALVERLMRDEAACTVNPAPGQDLAAYADTLFVRFANPALPHGLAQIAMDGSQKIGQRWLEPLAINHGRGLSCPATLAALAAWIRHARGDDGHLDDPMADRLRALWAEAGRDGIAAALFGRDGLFAAAWQADDAAIEALRALLAEA
ncbi:mannitol dehydrogenase [Sphingomonas metalli]|uniref:Mannitol dehydrogenase n=1 Tax=Sphingomonas metalli TaxID=1779358 RepID=A0A916TGL1_9SPHN|nr:mannitol dehydrogenase family protein [Sphingomonas metalli]GGB41659.1 mannitol dehydrogenase [Sphingomonas metalli]